MSIIIRLLHRALALSITPFNTDLTVNRERRTITMKCNMNISPGFIVAIMALIIVVKLCA
nr:MAG TPA: hypothetical protein [Caudoviricetes sp.]